MLQRQAEDEADLCVFGPAIYCGCTRLGKMTPMRCIAVATLTFALVLVCGCDEGRSSSGGGASSPQGGGGAGEGGGGAGESECIGKLCGDPCYTCADPPCSQLICDDNETCQPALDVTCTQ